MGTKKIKWLGKYLCISILTDQQLLKYLDANSTIFIVQYAQECIFKIVESLLCRKTR